MNFSKKELLIGWKNVLFLIFGILLTLFFIYLVNGSINLKVVDGSIRMGEVITWILWIILYIGTPYLLKAYVDDEREVKKMINEDINSLIEHLDQLNLKLKNLINKSIDEPTSEQIHMDFEIIERELDSLNKIIKECYKSWDENKSKDLQLNYLKYKNLISPNVTKRNFVIDQDFYSRQAIDMTTFIAFLKNIKISIIRS